jgi:hypothetical protein
MALWYIFWRFGTYIFLFWYVVTRKIWQTWPGLDFIKQFRPKFFAGLFSAKGPFVKVVFYLKHLHFDNIAFSNLKADIIIYLPGSFVTPCGVFLQHECAPMSEL